MAPGLLLLFLVAGLLALLPVWRLHRADWPAGSLFTAWVLYALGIFVAVRFAGPFRYLLPILVLAYVVPFVAGPERLTRIFRARHEPPRVIINVTPPPPVGLPEPPTPTGAGSRAARDDGDEDNESNESDESDAGDPMDTPRAPGELPG